jgi:O-glycosyl hydrolase
LPNVAFKTPDGKKVLIVANTGDTAQDFNINTRAKILRLHLDKGSVGTISGSWGNQELRVRNQAAQNNYCLHVITQNGR